MASAFTGPRSTTRPASCSKRAAREASKRAQSAPSFAPTARAGGGPPAGAPPPFCGGGVSPPPPRVGRRGGEGAPADAGKKAVIMTKLALAYLHSEQPEAAKKIVEQL